MRTVLTLPTDAAESLVGSKYECLVNLKFESVYIVFGFGARGALGVMGWEERKIATGHESVNHD